MEDLVARTNSKEEVVDITGLVAGALSGKGDGVCGLFVLHTTAALTTADLDPGTDRDMPRAYREMVPRLPYRHPHDPSHVGDHIMASLIGPSVSVPFEDGEPKLGTWQRIVLIEFDGPRERTIRMTWIGT